MPRRLFLTHFLLPGFERFSNYQGYASSFQFGGNHIDDTPIEIESWHRKSRLVAIDALYFPQKDARGEQYRMKNILRELNKAYVGFYSEQ